MDLTPRERAEAVRQALLEAFGVPHWEKQDALDELLNTVLSQNTNDRNRDLAYENMRQQYPTWADVRDADPEALIDAIRIAGLANQKGPRIQEILKTITAEQGKLDLGFLDSLSLEEVRKWLTDLKGVGPKTASIVMVFSLGLPAFPVDTHVYRVSGRIGFREETVSVEDAHVVLANLFPPDSYGEVHLNLIYLGRRVCHARKPECAGCPVNHLCLFPDKTV